MINTDILIVGGGISGLHTAYKLQQRGVNFILVEARERLGGRILSQNYKPNVDSVYDANQPAYDLGPSWFWPGQQNMEALVHELDLIDSIFPQQGSGQSLYEDQLGNIQKGFHGISMQGIYRMQGGIRQFIANLEERIETKHITKSALVKCIELRDHQIITSLTTNDDSDVDNYQIVSNKVVIALPPRIAVSAIKFNPPLSESRISELNSYATWMAGHAKILAIYNKPFWLEQDLSGDAISQLGPLREIHDASSHLKESDGFMETQGHALFGFVAVPASYRKDNEEEIKNLAIEQLIRLFGKSAENPVDIVLQDWAQQEFTASELDQTMSSGHATSSISITTEATFDHHLIWSGTETADHHTGSNGLLEGALEASIRTLEILS